MKLVLSESRHFIIKNEYETAYLIDKKTGKIISVVADMYGDPIGAGISETENYCVIFGCGAVVYFIKEPFKNYEHGCGSEQWFEVGADGSAWFDEIKYQDSFKVILLSEDRREYEIDTKHRTYIMKGQ